MRKIIRGSSTTVTRRGRRSAQGPRLVPGAASGTLAVATVLLSGQLAYADCTPQAGGSNYTATCTGVTTNQGGGAPGTSADVNGFGSGGETPRHLHRERERLCEPHQIDLAPASGLVEDMKKVRLHGADSNAEQF